MYSLGDMAKDLNRPAVYLRGLQARFELPAFEGAAYPDAYLSLLRTFFYLRALNIPEDSLRQLWMLEKKLLRLLNLDSTGSQTWFLDACGLTTHRQRRLLLTNYDLGVELPSRNLQLGLDFSQKMTEFFEGREMGEEALKVLNGYLKLYGRISALVAAEAELVRRAVRWASRVEGTSKATQKPASLPSSL